jgi:hypothetical protein
MLFLSGSLRVEWIKWAFGRVVFWTMSCCLALAGNLVRGLCLAVSALMYPATRRLYDPSSTCVVDYIWPDWLVDKETLDQGPAYSRTSEERIGMSISWRVSAEKGYEFRVGYWHYYDCQVRAIRQAVMDALPAAFVGVPGSSARPLSLSARPLPAWFARHFCALGLSTAAPMPDPPHVSCSGLLSLSGFYFQKDKTTKKTRGAAAAPAAASTSTSTSSSAWMAAAIDTDTDSESEPESEAENANEGTGASATKSPWQLLRDKEKMALESAMNDSNNKSKSKSKKQSTSE